jgi:hypothetical protein
LTRKEKNRAAVKGFYSAIKSVLSSMHRKVAAFVRYSQDETGFMLRAENLFRWEDSAKTWIKLDF